MQSILERERVADPSDQVILETVNGTGTEPEIAAGIPEASPVEFESDAAASAAVDGASLDGPSAPAPEGEIIDQKTEKDPFDEIDFGTFFDDYLDPGYKSPASETVEKPSFETFLSSPVTLADHLHSQLARAGDVRRRARRGRQHHRQPERERLPDGDARRNCRFRAAHAWPKCRKALRIVQSLDPAGVGAKDVRECLLLQIESRNGKGGVAWQIVANHLKLVETAADQGNGQAAGPAAGAHPDRHGRDPASGPAIRVCAIRTRARGRWSRTSTSSKKATNTSSS